MKTYNDAVVVRGGVVLFRIEGRKDKDCPVMSKQALLRKAQGLRRLELLWDALGLARIRELFTYAEEQAHLELPSQIQQLERDIEVEKWQVAHGTKSIHFAMLDLRVLQGQLLLAQARLAKYERRLQFIEPFNQEAARWGWAARHLEQLAQ